MGELQIVARMGKTDLPQGLTYITVSAPKPLRIEINVEEAQHCSVDQRMMQVQTGTVSLH